MRKRKPDTIFNEEGFGTIYSITNTANGMKYVGQTQKEYLSNRIGEHFARAKSGRKSPLYDDIRNQKRTDFKVEVLEKDVPVNQLWDKEKHYVKELNTVYPNGYNIALGGGGTPGVVPWDKGVPRSEETKRKISEKFTDERKRKQSERMRGEGNPNYDVHIGRSRCSGENNYFYGVHMFGEDNPFYGRHHTDETKAILSDAQNDKKKSVSMYSLDGIRLQNFDSLSEASRYLQENTKFKKADDSFIGKCAKGKHESAYGFKWRFEKGE